MPDFDEHQRAAIQRALDSTAPVNQRFEGGEWKPVHPARGPDALFEQADRDLLDTPNPLRGTPVRADGSPWPEVRVTFQCGESRVIRPHHLMCLGGSMVCHAHDRLENLQAIAFEALKDVPPAAEGPSFEMPPEAERGVQEDGYNCPKHGPVSYVTPASEEEAELASGSFTGFAGGHCTWALLTCGCYDVDESDDVEAAK